MIYTFIFSFVFSLFTIPFLRKIAIKYNIVDKPDNNLKTHENSIPYLGGAAFIFSFLLFTPFSLFRKLYIMILGILGLYDDIKSINPWIRLFVEIIIGALVAVRFLANPIEIMIAAIFYAFLINSVNMMDGMDGICASVSAISAFRLLWTVTYPYDKYFLLSLIGSLLAYLFYNFPPAKIFMGDMGSYAIGDILGDAIASSLAKGYVNLLASIIIITPFILDTVSSILRRMLNKRSPLSGDRDHVYDKLYRRLKSKRKTLFYMIIISSIFTLLGIYFLFNQYISAILTIIFTFLLIVKLNLLKYDKNGELKWVKKDG